MNIQFIRLDSDVCVILNEMARDKSRTVSELVNDVLRAHLRAVESAGGSNLSLSEQE